MPLAYAMWIHGHSMTVEYADRIATLERQGNYIQVTGRAFSSNWFHFAIPTPVIVNDKRLQLGSILLRFRTGGATSLKAIHVWDGETRILVNDSVDPATNEDFQMSRFAVPGNPEVRWGVGISLNAEFGDPENLKTQRPLMFEVSSAGCDFLA